MGPRVATTDLHEVLQSEAYHSSLPPAPCGLPAPVLAIVIIIAVRREEESILLLVVVIVGLFEESVER